jgi:hypothetical protein
MTARWHVATALLLLSLAFPAPGGAQTAGPVDLRARLLERYDVVAVQQGVALVPKQADSSVRLVQVTGGVVAVDGEVLTGQQLRDRLGPDADLVLQVSYLDVERQRLLAGSPAPGVTAGLEPPPTPVSRTQVRRGDVVRFGGDVSVTRDEKVEGDVVALGGGVTIDGEVTGDVVGIGGPVSLGAESVVGGDVNVIGGTLSRAPGAQVQGSVNEVGAGAAGRFGRGRRWQTGFGDFWSRLGSAAATVFRLTLVGLLGLALVAFGRPWLDRVADRTAAAPVRSGLAGLLAEILFLPLLVLTVVVLAVSIVGIPLLVFVPFAVVLVMLMMLVGFLGLALRIGRGLMSQVGWLRGGDYVALVLGVVAIGGLSLIAKLAGLAGSTLLGAPLTVAGFAVEYVAWTMGLGAVILALHQRRFGGTPAGISPGTGSVTGPLAA